MFETFFDVTSDGEIEISIDTKNHIIFHFSATKNYFNYNKLKNKCIIFNKEMKLKKMLFNRQNKNLKVDPYYSDIPNINFSVQDIENDDGTFQKERLERGFDSSELWNLDSTIAKFILPRLKEFRNKAISFPMEFCELNSEKGLRVWKRILDKMILSFYLISKNDDIDESINSNNNKKQQNTIDNGLYLFYYYFRDLWN